MYPVGGRIKYQQYSFEGKGDCHQRSRSLPTDMAAGRVPHESFSAGCQKLIGQREVKQVKTSADAESPSLAQEISKPLPTVTPQSIISECMQKVSIHSQCHVNILRFSNLLINSLPTEVMDKISVLVLLPDKQFSCSLHNTFWKFHVVLRYEEDIFDFHKEDEKDKYNPQNETDYIYCHFFCAFRKRLHSMLESEDLHNKYKAFDLIDGYFDNINSLSPIDIIEIPCSEYVKYVNHKNEIDLFKLKYLNCSIFRRKRFNRKEYLEFYRKQYGGKIQENDRLLLLYILSHPNLKHSDMVEISGEAVHKILVELNWPELSSLQGSFGNLDS